jgi:CRISPR system Cascade subunit CasD
MSNKLGLLLLRLEGVFQSWGFDSQYDRRNTRMMPTRSAIAGICCAALGYDRGSLDEHRFLTVEFPNLKMTSISVSKKIQTQFSAGPKTLKPRRMSDYHTVQNTRKAIGGIKSCHLTSRYYISDAMFGVLLFGDYSLLNTIADALKDPIWGLWLGRKCCIPSAPIFAGLFADETAALEALIDDAPQEQFVFEKEAERFQDAKDSILDRPLSFDSSNRRFAPRRTIVSSKA